MRSRAFTVAELLVSIAVIALLLAILLPALGQARAQGRRVVCASNLAQLGVGFHMYAGDYSGRAMPLAYTQYSLIKNGPPIYWWGTNAPKGVDHTRGFVWPYLQSDLRERSVYECPDQPWGTYVAQGAAMQVTSTYGYNGYYLSPPHTPGWSYQIGSRPWQNLDLLRLPQNIFTFADTAADLGADAPHNNALLDPPLIYTGRGRWSRNRTPTTSFRHSRSAGGGTANVVHADGHVASYSADRGLVTSQRFNIGSVSEDNDPHYVPDWREW